MRPLLLCLALLAVPTVEACTPPPPQLGPVAQADFQKTRVIKGLDLLRDFAIDAEAASPQVLSTATTRKVVAYHQSALKILDAAGGNWRALVGTALDEALVNIPTKEAQQLAPYVALVKALLVEV